MDDYLKIIERDGLQHQLQPNYMISKLMNEHLFFNVFLAATMDLSAYLLQSPAQHKIFINNPAGQKWAGFFHV